MYPWIASRSAAIVATIECALQSEAMLGLIVRNALGPIKLGQPSFDFGQKYEPFNGIVDGGIWRHRLEGLDNAVAGKWLLHGSIVNTFRGRWNYTLTSAGCTRACPERSRRVRVAEGELTWDCRVFPFPDRDDS